MRKGPCRFGSRAQKYESKLGRRFLEEHHKPPSDTGIPPQKSEPKIGLVTKSRLRLQYAYRFYLEHHSMLQR